MHSFNSIGLSVDLLQLKFARIIKFGATQQHLCFTVIRCSVQAYNRICSKSMFIFKMNLIDFKSFSAISVRKRMVRLFNFEPPTCKTSRLFKIQSEQIVPAISYMMASFFSPFFLLRFTHFSIRNPIKSK